MSQFDWYPTALNSVYDPTVEFNGGARIKEDWSNVGGYWAFEDNVGDRSPNGYDGTIIGSLTYIDPGKIGKGLLFDGVPTNYIEFGDRFNFEYTDNFSLECWFRTSSLGGSARVLMGRQIVGGTKTNGWTLLIRPDGKPMLSIVSNLQTNNRIERWVSLATPNWIDNQWHHVVAVYTYPGLTPVIADAIRIWVDGVEYNYSATTSELTGTITSLATFQIGRNGNYANWSGALDEAVVWTEELDLEQVQCRYNDGFGKRRVFVFPPPVNVATNSGFYNPLMTYFTGFVEKPGPEHQGELGYQLSPDGVNWYVYNQGLGEWEHNGPAYNTANVVNENIFSFPFTTIWIKAFLISDADGCHEVELQQITIVYSLGQAPILSIGINITVPDNTYAAPFFDSTFYDPDSPAVETAYYKIEGLVDTYTEIPQGSYESLQEAVQSFNFFWNTPGTWKTWLKVADEETNETEDYKYVTVEKYTVTFNVTDSESGAHVSNIQFDPGDGSGYQSVDSPFEWLYEYGPWNAVINTDTYGARVVPLVVIGDLIVNVQVSKFLREANIPDIVDAVWDEPRLDHQLSGSTGQSQGVIHSKWIVTDIGADRVLQIYDESGNLVIQLKLYFDGPTPYARIPL